MEGEWCRKSNNRECGWFYTDIGGMISTHSRFKQSLSPHDALKHHFTYLKTDLIFLQPIVLEQKFS